MKTERQCPIPPARDEVLLVEEVLVVTAAQAPVRTLLVRALVAVVELVHRKEAFEIRRLNQDLLCSFDGEKYSGRVEILTVLRPLQEYMEQFAHAIGQSVAESMTPILKAQILAELKAKAE